MDAERHHPVCEQHVAEGDERDAEDAVEPGRPDRDVLAEYQRATDEWELERSEIERLLRDVSAALEAPRPPASS